MMYERTVQLNIHQQRKPAGCVGGQMRSSGNPVEQQDPQQDCDKR